MALQIKRNEFDGLPGALKDVAALGLWPTTYITGAAPEAQVHWHDYDVHVYVIQGETYFIDNETGEKHDVVAGDKVVIPARSLHAEGLVKEQMLYLIGLPQPVASREFLAHRKPELLEQN